MEEWGRCINSEKLLQREEDSMYDICIGKAARAGFKNKKRKQRGLLLFTTLWQA